MSLYNRDNVQKVLILHGFYVFFDLILAEVRKKIVTLHTKYEQIN